jgi:hypothetical protein
MMRSTYTSFVMPGLVCVVDLDQGRSVTNDIENVLDDLAEDLSPGGRLLYLDTQNLWSEVAYSMRDGRPHFEGYRPWPDDRSKP